MLSCWEFFQYVIIISVVSKAEFPSQVHDLVGISLSLKGSHSGMDYNHGTTMKDIPIYKFCPIGQCNEPFILVDHWPVEGGRMSSSPAGPHPLCCNHVKRSKKILGVFKGNDADLGKLGLVPPAKAQWLPQWGCLRRPVNIGGTKRPNRTSSKL